MSTTYNPGDRVVVTSRYGGLFPGHAGRVVSAWCDPHGVERVRLDVGANQTGQRLRQVIPAKHVEPAQKGQEVT